jgi:hypothetical protein
LLTEVCSDVKVEPDLQPVPDGISLPASAITTDGARLDIAMNGFWGGRFERSLVDVRIFNPHAPSYKHDTSKGSIQSMRRRRKDHMRVEYKRLNFHHSPL